MRSISIKGVIFGVLAIFVIDLLSGIYGIILFADGMSEEALILASQSQNYLLWGLLVGTASTVVGGFIAAKIGKLAPYQNASVIGILGVVIGIILGGENPLWFDVTANLTVIPAALLGGYLVVRKHAS